MNKTIVFVILLQLCFSPLLPSQSLVVNWKLESGGKIVAAPVANDQYAFVGNENGLFMAIDLEIGEIAWQLETDGSIQSKALLFDDHVFFESGNVYYALEQESGEEVWRYDPQMEPEKFTYGDKDFLFKLDPFDDKRSAANLHNGIIYVGCSDGNLIGLKSTTGDIALSINTIDQAPVRSSPLVAADKIYFGDWNGVVYCYDLQSEEFLWTKKTYRVQFYPTFGGIASEFCIYNGMLFYGARNHMMNVLWLDDGQKEWTYTDPDGGWIIGDPVIFNDTLYIGGSDNFAILAFNPSSGKLLWKTKREKNIYGKPIVTENWIIYGGGNSYDPRDTGEVVVLNRSTGIVVSSFETTSSVFSSPVFAMNEHIIFGSSDGTVYSLSIQE